MTRKFLDSVYDHPDMDVADFYDDWAATYDAEVGDNGYVTPTRCAKALRAQVANLETPVLDLGCGTGLSGLALRAAGFTTLDGTDLSDGMLKVARDKGIYRHLFTVTPDTPIPTELQGYELIAAIGVIGVGAAPVSLLDAAIAALKTGGKLVFSYNDHALEDPVYEGRLTHHIDARGVRLLSRERGPHLPARGISSNVYVIEKL